MSSALVEYPEQVSLYELSLLDMKARPKRHQRFKKVSFGAAIKELAKFKTIRKKKKKKIQGENSRKPSMHFFFG